MFNVVYNSDQTVKTENYNRWKTKKEIDYNQNRKKSNKTIIYKQKLNGQNLKLAAIGATKTIII